MRRMAPPRWGLLMLWPTCPITQRKAECSMSFRCLSVIFFLCISLKAGERRVLRVCADPNNLPFSNQAGDGLENHLANLIAKELNAEVSYTWWTETKSFIKNSLGENQCDVIMGVPSTLDSVSPTRPYYRSTYVFVTR